jgi:pimeloyl-ACP methyl ester carboxylesterase
MATFVLVHGSWHGSWCWKRVRSSLQSLGHEVFTPTLTGVGERSHLLARDINLQTHTLDILNLILWEELTDLVLCGHSYAGMVISAVADRIPERIHSLVFLDAFVPEHGQRLTDFVPISGDQLVDDWKVRPLGAEMLGLNLADRQWVNSQCTAHPVACFQQPAELGGGIAHVGRIFYVYASGWAGYQSPFYPFYEKAKSRGWSTSEIDCGHDVMLDRPDALTTVLLRSV